MPTRFLRSRTTLGVRHVPTSVEFYRRALGFDVVVTMGEPPTFAIVGLEGIGPGLVQTQQPAVAALACCYFDVEGVEAIHHRCVDAGARITVALTRQP